MGKYLLESYSCRLGGIEGSAWAYVGEQRLRLTLYRAIRE
jgi:hypothetical protein